MDDRAPLFSLIIPARNMETHMQETLDSVAAQNLTNFEVICLDDGSTDRTRAIFDQMAATDPRFKPMDGPATGVSAARNLGLSLARGIYVLFLDADDLLSADALERYAAVLQDDPGVAVIGGVQKISHDGAVIPGPDNRDLVPAEDQLEALLKKNYVVNGGALALRTETARTVGAYDTGLKNGEDWEFWCRIALNTRFAALDGDPVLYYRQLPSGANHQTRGSPFARRVASLDRIAKNPAFQARFGRKLNSFLRARRIDFFWSGVRNQFKYGQKAKAFGLGLAGMFLYPDSILRPKLILRFLKSARG